MKKTSTRSKPLAEETPKQELENNKKKDPPPAPPPSRDPGQQIRKIDPDLRSEKPRDSGECGEE